MLIRRRDSSVTRKFINYLRLILTETYKDACDRWHVTSKMQYRDNVLEGKWCVLNPYDRALLCQAISHVACIDELPSCIIHRSAIIHSCRVHRHKCISHKSDISRKTIFNGIIFKRNTFTCNRMFSDTAIALHQPSCFLVFAVKRTTRDYKHRANFAQWKIAGRQT
jgi:hypothetical protein